MADDAATRAVAEEVQVIEDSLDFLLSAIELTDVVELRPRKDFTAQSFDEVVTEFTEKMGWSKVRRAADTLYRDPVGEALRNGVRALGERLFEIGGLEAMQDVCDRVAERHDGRHGGARLGIMDHRWDGIGRDAENVGWCA